MGEDTIDFSDTIVLTPEEKDKITQDAPEEEVQDNEKDEVQDS
jgi:hypothetical protein